MPTLTKKQREFCKWYAHHENATQAAIQAGYSEATAKEMGYENLTKPHIKTEVDLRKMNIVDRFQLAVEDSIRTLEEIRDDVKVAPTCRINAATDLMDRAGTKAVEKQEMKETFDVSGELAKLHIAYAAALGNSDELREDC